MAITKIAVPSAAPGGLDADRSGHFGRCDCFTIVEIDDDGRLQASVVENPPHVHGGCLAPVQLLAKQRVQAIVVSGIGATPLHGFRSEGIEVFLGHGDKVSDSIQALLDEQLRRLSEEEVCGGH